MQHFDVESVQRRPVSMRGRMAPTSWFRSKKALALLVTFATIVLLGLLQHTEQIDVKGMYEKYGGISKTKEATTKPAGYDPRPDIPNIAHFVRQINRDDDYNAKGPFKVEFRHLLSYYSCSLFVKPETLYFWTDTPQELLEDARVNGDIYTRAFFKLPKLMIKHVAFPNKTSTGFPIQQYAHRSDFVRTVVLSELGGIYLDDDAWVLRDLSPLRKAGYDNVFSLDDGERIAQAAFLSKPGNPLMKAFAKYQDVYFNGGWLRASNELVTSLMVHFSRSEESHAALVLEKDAFFPGYWQGNHLNMYYEVHDDDVATFRESGSSGPPTIDNFEYDFEWGWRRDWRRSYIVHGWSNEVRVRKAEYMFKEFKTFSPEYIYSRRSNIGRALYPALANMMETGFLPLQPEDFGHL